MNAAMATVLESFELDQEHEASRRVNGPGEKFRMARRPQNDQLRKRPKQYNGIHRRRRKKIRL